MIKTLRYSLHRIALIRTHSLPIDKLTVPIRRINDAPPIRNRERGKSVHGPELAAPAAADRVDATADAAVIGVLGGRSVGGVDAVVAGGHGGDVGVDEEVVVAEGGVGAGAGEGFDGPFGGVGYGHGFGGCDGDGEGGDGGEGGGEEEGGGELHRGGWVRWVGMVDIGL